MQIWTFYKAKSRFENIICHELYTPEWLSDLKYIIHKSQEGAQWSRCWDSKVNMSAIDM